MTNFFDWASAPWFTVLGDFALPLVWGFVVSMIYLKSENSGLTITVGVFLLSALATTNSYIDSSTNVLYFWAVAIAVVAFGSSLFYLIKVRAQSPT